MLHFNVFDKLWPFSGMHTRNKLDEAEKGIYGLDDSKETTASNHSVVCLNQLIIGTNGTFKSMILGRRACGKTTLVKQLLKSCKLHPSSNLIFNGVENITPVYGLDDEIKAVSEIHAQYDGGILQRFLHIHEKDFGRKVINVVFDNCFDMGSSKDAILESLMTMPVNVIFVVDNPITLPLQIKAKCNFLFLFKENVYTIRKRIFDIWKLQTIFSSMEVYNGMYASATDAQYGYLLVDFNKSTCYVGRALPTFKSSDQLVTKYKSHQVGTTCLDTIPEEIDLTDVHL